MDAWSEYKWWARDEAPPSWNVEFKLTERDYPNLADYRETWGDEPRWTSMLLYGWKTCTQPSLAPRVAVDRDVNGKVAITDANIGLFSLALHLLALGVGWTDIAKGLRTWRLDGFQPGRHPILDYLMAAMGTEALTALEVFCGVHDNTQMHDALRRLVHYPRQPDSSASELDTTRMYEAMRTAMSREGKLTLDQDSLHLTAHFADSLLGPNVDFDLPRFHLQEFRPKHSFRLLISAYRSWAFALAAEPSLRPAHDDGLQSLDYEVEVHVYPIGYIGHFLRSHDTNRWFMTSFELNLKEQFAVHRWGQEDIATEPESISTPPSANQDLLDLITDARTAIYSVTAADEASIDVPFSDLDGKVQFQLSKLVTQFGFQRRHEDNDRPPNGDQNPLVDYVNIPEATLSPIELIKYLDELKAEET